jgi:hypothetical protein
MQDRLASTSSIANDQCMVGPCIARGVPTANPKPLTATANRLILAPGERPLQINWCALIGLFRSRVALEAEILVLRHQLNVLRRNLRSDWRPLPDTNKGASRSRFVRPTAAAMISVR